MGYMSNKAIIIAVSLLITISITSAILLIIGQVKNIYRTVYETDTSIHNGVDEFDVYNSTVKNSLDLVNTAKKYKERNDVTIKVENSGFNGNYSNLTEKNNLISQIEDSSYLDVKREDENIIINSDSSADRYNVSINQSNSITTIIFKKM